MKKVLALVLALVLSLAMFTACAPKGDSGDKTDTKTTFTIGIVDPGTADATSVPLYNSLYQTITSLGGKYVLAAQEESSPDALLNAVNNLLSKNVDGIILSNLIAVYGLVPAVADLCNENGVYWSLFWTTLEEGTEAYDAAMNSKYFVSTSCEDDVYSGYFATKILGLQGCKKICTVTLPEGFGTTNLRNEGMQKALDEFGMEVLGTCSDSSLTSTASGGATITEDFLAAYPDLDGIAVLGMSQFVLSGVVQALEDAGRTDIAVGCIDFHEYQHEYMKTGVLDGIIGGHFAGPTYSAILMANVLTGHPLVEGPQIIKNNFIELASFEDADVYASQVYGKCLYTDAELANCLVINNPDFTYADLMAMAQSYSLEDIIARTSK